MTARGVLIRLLDATPMPPPAADEPDADALIAAWTQIHAQRQAVLDELTAPLRVATDEERGLVRALEDRRRAWHDALAGAQQRIGAQRIATGKLRRYAPPTAL
ncbi:MAG: hypothetical protein ACTHU0_31730 [Kofleriaceae bacterium]